MLSVQLRQKYRSNGLIDDIVVHGAREDYVYFADQVMEAFNSSRAVVMRTDSSVCIEISRNDEWKRNLFTSLQNERNDYVSPEDWEGRSILRIIATGATLSKLAAFLIDLSGRGVGYSYLAEFSESDEYDRESPEWRLHVKADPPEGVVVSLDSHRRSG